MNQPSKQNTEHGPKQEREGRAMLFKPTKNLELKPAARKQVIHRTQHKLNGNT